MSGTLHKYVSRIIGSQTNKSGFSRGPNCPEPISSGAYLS